MLQVTYPSPGEHPSAPRERGIFPITDDELCDLASTAQLPVPIKADVASLVVVAQTIAVTSSLFAAVQISFNSIIEAAVFTSETPQLRGYTLKTWLYLRWFLYAAVIVNLGSAGAAVAVINLATSLECEFSRFAVLYHHGDKEALRRYKDAYDWVLREIATIWNG